MWRFHETEEVRKLISVFTCKTLINMLIISSPNNDCYLLMDKYVYIFDFM